MKEDVVINKDDVLISKEVYKELLKAKNYLYKVTSISSWFEVYTAENWFNESDEDLDEYKTVYYEIERLLTSYALGESYREGYENFKEYIKERDKELNNPSRNIKGIKEGDFVYIKRLKGKEINKVYKVLEVHQTSFKLENGRYVLLNNDGDKYYKLT